MVSVFDLIKQTGPVIQFVILLLVGASVLSWTIIFGKWRSLKQAKVGNELFLDTFWSSKNIEDIYGKADLFPTSPVASVFRSGFKELKKISTPDVALDDSSFDNIRRALNRTSNQEVSTLENHIGWLATTASASPFVGLFGTVWGIMSAFHQIGVTGSANLAVVAPGISEALITTAIGIGAAIPAVVAYNHFAGQIKRLTMEIDNFSQDFLNIINRNLGGRRKGV
jgi:biopolymer transport protein TolQ